MERCVKSEPRHGEMWNQVAKGTKNWRKKTDEILPIVARTLKPVENI